MAKRKRPDKAKPPAESAGGAAAPSEDTPFFGGSGTLHDLFQKQVRSVLDQSDMDEQAKQAVLVALNCPCCGTGAMNYTVKINRRS